MNAKCKLAIAVVVPFVLIGCNDDINLPEGPVATSGDEVQFQAARTPQSRTMYTNEWDETKPQEIYWGNYVDGKDEYINIYCPDTDRGFARYKVDLQEQPSNVAGSIVRMGDVGVQWGDPAVPHTFYAFYPADKAGTTLDNQNTIRATVGTGQSPQVYKRKVSDGYQNIESFKAYNETQYSSGAVTSATPQVLYGMPDMDAAVMVARRTMSVEEFGQPVPLQFNVLADVLDITLNGPVTPNTLGGNSDKTPRDFIQIQGITIEVVDLDTPDATPSDPSTYDIDDSLPISGSFDLNMSAEAVGTDKMVTNVSGNPTVLLQTSMSENNSVYYPTLFVRGESTAPSDLDRLRLRAFLIPGQITGKNMNKLRVHLQTNCGEFYQMLKADEANFVSGKIYPVKFGYFLSRGSDFKLEGWIEQLDPNIYISELSIPGAWHAANPLFQSTTDLRQMYEAGIRAFEVHTRNGNTPMKYGQFGVPFDINNETENFKYPFIRKGSDEVKYEYSDLQLDESTASNIDYTIGSLNGTRTVQGTATVIRSTSVGYEYIVPKFWLRLFRTQDSDNTGTPLSTAIINLSEIMNEKGLMFLEFGMDGERDDVPAIPYRSGAEVFDTRTLTNVSITVTERCTRPNVFGSWTPTGEYTKYEINGQADFSTVAAATVTSALPDGTIQLTAKEAWAIAVRSCFERLASEVNSKTGKPILYSGDLTANTTISDVQGQIVAKINTNDDENEARYLWGDDSPALFSRWMADSGEKPLTINLKWNSPVAPYGADGLPDSDLRWCFTELDNIDQVGMDKRKLALVNMNKVAASNYAGGLHRTFYESSIGGFTEGSASDASCQAAARELNPYMLSRITDPTRVAVPLGLVFMNYVIAPDEDTYKSAELIRAIINNNQAFLLNRRGQQAAPEVEKNVNSHFTNNTKNPLK